ncbi:MAG: hypothetical protein EXS47_00410 [Candidatus Zambryskibacteria bacterium]|nr:hypothetical protein [Candidatus Zambryskibacteria bacterium]
MMQAILQNELDKLGMGDVCVESAGTNKGSEGNEINVDSAKELALRGLHVDGHKSRHIGSVGPVELFDIILCAGEEQAEQIRNAYPVMRFRVRVVNAKGDGVPNPWQLGPAAYTACAALVEFHMREIATELKTKW